MCLPRPCGCDVLHYLPLRIVGSPPVREHVREMPLAFPAPHHYDPNQMLVNFPLWLWLSFRAWSASVSSGDWPPTAELLRFCVSSLGGLTRTMRAFSSPRHRGDILLAAMLFMQCAMCGFVGPEEVLLIFRNPATISRFVPNTSMMAC